MVGDTLEAKLTPELNYEKGGFMQPGGCISPGTAVIIPLGSSWDCCDHPHLRQFGTAQMLCPRDNGVSSPTPNRPPRYGG